MNVNRRTQAERAGTTRAALVAAARPLFAKHGYADVATEEVVRDAGVTRGALYHHFAGKRELFRAVVEQLESELMERIMAQAATATDPEAPDPMVLLVAGSEAFLDACLDPEVQQISLLDAPAVLGWDEWREIGEEHGLGLLQQLLQAAIDAGAIEPQPVRPLAHILMGALDEAGAFVARAEDRVQARVEVGETLARLLDGLRAR